MSKKQYLQTLQGQIQRLNLIIDRKIMMGRSYKLEARQHKMLLVKMRKFRNPSFFDKLASAFDREYA